MIRMYPICTWRYGHAPECPLRRADAVWWAYIVLLCGWFYGLVAFTPRP